MKSTLKPKRSASRIRPSEVISTPRAAVLPRRSADAATKKQLAAAPSPVPVQGAIRLDISNAQPPVLMALTLKIRDGLTDNVYYPDLTGNVAALTASYNGQRSLTDQIASLEAQLKAARIAQTAEAVNARDILKSSARACESYDPSDEALASVGWELRKGRSPSQLLPAPAKLTLRPTGFPGEMLARWGRVPNFRFYELQMSVPEDPAAGPDWDLATLRSITSASDTMPRTIVGKTMYVRVRTVNPKGPSPWSDAVGALVL